LSVPVRSPTPARGLRSLSDRRRTTGEIGMIRQPSPERILKMIEHYDAKRHVLNAMIQEANHAVEIDRPRKQ